MSRSRSVRPHQNSSGNNNRGQYNNYHQNHNSGLPNSRTTFNNQRGASNNKPYNAPNHSNNNQTKKPYNSSNYDPSKKPYSASNHSNYDTNKKSYSASNHSNYDYNKKSYNSTNRSGYDPNKKSFNSTNRSSYEPNKKSFNSTNCSGYDPNKKSYNSTNRSGYDPNKKSFNSTNRSGYDFNKKSYDDAKPKDLGNKSENPMINQTQKSYNSKNTDPKSPLNNDASKETAYDPRYPPKKENQTISPKTDDNNATQNLEKTSLPNSKVQFNINSNKTSIGNRTTKDTKEHSQVNKIGANQRGSSQNKTYLNRTTKETKEHLQSNNMRSNQMISSQNKTYLNRTAKPGTPNKFSTSARSPRSSSVRPAKHDLQTQDGRKEIAKKTLEIIKTGQYKTNQGTVDIKKDIEDCVKKTKTIAPKHYSKDWKPQSKQPGKMCHFEVLPESSFGAAQKLVKENKKTCVLNFASATKPGGGFINGKQAQEESLSRQSALYKSLESQKEMYDEHKKINDNFYTDYMIYSPEVPVFRNDKDENLLPESFKASVITSAAPNKAKIDEEKYSPSTEKKKHDLNKLIKDRCRKIVQCAIDEKNDALVLGAYGCGVFGNDPKEVSKAFKEVLVDEGYGKYLDNVVFAIPGQYSNNFRVFSSEFPPSSE